MVLRIYANLSSNLSGLDLEESRASIIEVSRVLFNSTKEDVDKFVQYCDGLSDNDHIRQIACKSVGIIFQKAKLPPWPQTRSMFLRDDFMKQFFYFTTLLDEDYKDLKNITKNIRLCEYLGIPSLFDRRKKIMKLMGAGENSGRSEFYEGDTISPPFGEVKLSKFIVQWFAQFREYFIHWNHQRGDVMIAMAEQDMSSK